MSARSGSSGTKQRQSGRVFLFVCEGLRVLASASNQPRLTHTWAAQMRGAISRQARMRARILRAGSCVTLRNFVSKMEERLGRAGVHTSPAPFEGKEGRTLLGL